MNVEKIITKNNVNVLFIDQPGTTAASVQMWFRAGSALESKEDQGVAHFLEHMFFKGTKKRPGSKIAEEVSTFERPPGLAVILVGEDPASAVYVRNKELACKQAGFFSDKIIKSENITEEQLFRGRTIKCHKYVDYYLIVLPLLTTAIR